MPLRPGKPGARSQPVHEAVQEVAPPHARPRGRSARIGSCCRVVAAPIWVQAWVGAVGRVRNASPIRNDSILPNVVHGRYYAGVTPVRPVLSEPLTGRSLLFSGCCGWRHSSWQCTARGAFLWRRARDSAGTLLTLLLKFESTSANGFAPCHLRGRFHWHMYCREPGV